MYKSQWRRSSNCEVPRPCIIHTIQIHTENSAPTIQASPTSHLSALADGAYRGQADLGRAEGLEQLGALLRGLQPGRQGPHLQLLLLSTGSLGEGERGSIIQTRRIYSGTTDKGHLSNKDTSVLKITSLHPKHAFLIQMCTYNIHAVYMYTGK